MESLRPRWRIIIGVVLWGIFMNGGGHIYDGWGGFFIFAFWTAALVTWIVMCLRIKYVDPETVRRQAEKAAADAEAQRIREEREAEEARRKAEREEWERTHGRMVFNIAGVTFKNDDGTKRQDLLKEVLASEGDCDITFEEYEYNGKPAVRIIYDDVHTLGNVPARMVSEFLKIMDNISAVNLDIKTFTPDDVDDDWDDNGDLVKKSREKIYRAKMHIVYDKAPD